VAVALGVYWSHLIFAVVFVSMYLPILSVVLFLQLKVYRVYLVVELVASTIRASMHSVKMLLVLVPSLLVIVVMSVFSEELWQALGRLPVLRLIGSIGCLIVPALILVISSLEREATVILGQFPDKNQIAEDARNTPFVEDRLQKGLISEEDLDRLTEQLSWRNAAMLADGLLPALHMQVKRWLVLLVSSTSLFLVVSFFVYFCVFFSVVLSPSLIDAWTGIEYPTEVVLPIGPFRYGKWIPASTMSIAKVSVVLAVLVAVMASVNAFTDEAIKEVFTSWLKRKASSWLAVSSLYLCATSPNYQIWGYAKKDKREGIANVSIVVPKGLSEELVQEACEHMESRLEEYRTLIIITAFEQNPERPVYERGLPGNRWQLLHNKVKGIREFEANPLILDELRYQHFLGRDLLREGKEPPDGWFGDTVEGVELAKAIWETDPDREWVLHPFTFTSDKLLSIEISLKKRKPESSHYRQYIQEVLRLTRQIIPDASTIMIELAFRDTTQTLARLFCGEDLPYVEYKDELMDKQSVEPPANWQ
jgi:hypothetical protein